MTPFYKDYSEYISEIFPDFKVQKISVNAGFSCPNRDGTIGIGGCIYCNNSSFTPSYCMEEEGNGITTQLEEGKRFFARKYPQMKYLAYFQSFTNTHGLTIGQLQRLYEEALVVTDVVGLVIGTRPDTLPDDVVAMLGRLSKRVPIFIEIGAETSCDATLRLINRGHTWADVADAARRCAIAGLHVGLHLIAGLPGEDEERVLRNVTDACSLPIESIKMHQLQVISGTALEKWWQDKKFRLLFDNPEDYAELCCRIVEIVPRHIAIERFLASAPPRMVVAPKWGLKNYQFTNLLHNKLKQKNI